MADNGAGEDEYLTHQFIGGVWRAGASERQLEVFDPYTRQRVSTFHAGTETDVDDAYRCANVSQPAWAKAPPHVRRAVFERAWQWVDDHFAEIADFLIREAGSTRFKAAFEIGLVSEALRTAAGLTASPVGKILPSPDPEKENRLYYEPVGVVSVIGPFNAPFFLGIRPLVQALALGNSVVLKPNELTPISGGTIIARMFQAAGLPDGVLNVVVTDIEEIGDGFISHPIPEVIAFTGSSHTGEHIAEVAGKHLKQAVLELGGNSALLVLDDADLELAVNAAIFSRFTHSGQICMSAGRVVVDESLYVDFLKLYTAKAAALPVGDPRDERTIVGPLITPAFADLLERQVAKAVHHGAVVTLAAKPRDLDSGLVSPIVLTNVTVDNPVSQVELFGPAVCIMKAQGETDAIRIANATPYGLSGSVHTRNVERGVRVARRIRTGMVHVNNGSIADESDVPFGGIGASGNGRLNGDAALQNFTRTMWISVHHGTPQFPY